MSEPRYCLITSQIDTAPKPTTSAGVAVQGLITSQIDTAPKPDIRVFVAAVV